MIGKRKNGKRLLSIFLAACMFLSVFMGIGIDARADDLPVTEDGFVYMLTSEGVSINGYTGTSTDIHVPSVIEGRQVTEIIYLISDNDEVTSVSIPEGVKKLGARAICNCSKLSSVSIPASLQKVTFGNPYDYCNPFTGCPALSDISVAERTAAGGYAAYYAEDGVLFSLDKTVLVACPAKEAYVVPDSVTKLARAAFAGNTKLTSVVLSDEISKIETEAFRGCESLTSVQMSDWITEIDYLAFNACTSLKSIQLPEHLSSIGEGAFAGCSSLENMNIPYGVSEIQASAFLACKSLRAIHIPASVAAIGQNVFLQVSAGDPIIYGTPGSYAEIYAAENEYVFISEADSEIPFRDVPMDKYYTNAVLWAYHSHPQITTGTSDTTFEPSLTCNRAQVVTFLWRLAGMPEPETTVNPFTDVNSTAYYYKAVLWAVEAGVTTGTSSDKFSPKAPCQRKQFVTFLWRACGSHAPAETGNPFEDVEAGKYYTDAVLWASQNGITTGTDAAHFSPSKEVSRCQTVTFLYRARRFVINWV